MATAFVNVISVGAACGQRPGWEGTRGSFQAPRIRLTLHTWRSQMADTEQQEMPHAEHGPRRR